MVVLIVRQDDGALDGDSDVESDIATETMRQSPGQTPFLFLSPLWAQGQDPTNKLRSKYPDVAVDGRGVAHVVWQDDGDLDMDGDTEYDIYCKWWARRIQSTYPD